MYFHYQNSDAKIRLKVKHKCKQNVAVEVNFKIPNLTTCRINHPGVDTIRVLATRIAYCDVRSLLPWHAKFVINL